MHLAKVGQVQRLMTVGQATLHVGDTRQLNNRLVARMIAGMKPLRPASTASEANRERMRCDFCRKRGLLVRFGVVESTRTYWEPHGSDSETQVA